MNLKKALENSVEKGENARYQHFLFLPVFSILSKREIVILEKLNLSSSNAFNLVSSKILLIGIEFKIHSVTLSRMTIC